MLGRWTGRGGLAELVQVSLPLVVSFGTTSVMHFTDRMFLAGYSLEAVSASLPAGILSFLLLCFFMGTAGYANVFVAQYTGAGQRTRVGASIWQAVYFSLASGALLALFYLPADFIFDLVGHPPAVRHLEVVYFRILTLGAGLVVLATALSCFFSGRGFTRPVMMVNLAAAAINIPLDWALINGWGPFPELGIAGAALATVVAQTVMCALFAILVFVPRAHRDLGILSAWRLDRELMARLMRYGLPGGVQMFLEIFAFSIFILVVGRLGAVELAATNIVVAINSLGFMPMVGLSVGVSILVGQAIGRGEPGEAHASTMNALVLGLAYMAVMIGLYLLFPEWLMGWFHPRGAEAAQYQPIMETGVALLKVVAVYTAFDGVAIILSGTLKGAGDVRFVMWAIVAASLSVLLTPVVIVVGVMDLGIIPAWLCPAAYVMVLAIIMALRYRGGRWREMRVIEQPPAPHPAPAGPRAPRTPHAAPGGRNNNPA